MGKKGMGMEMEMGINEQGWESRNGVGMEERE